MLSSSNISIFKLVKLLISHAISNPWKFLSVTGLPKLIRCVLYSNGIHDQSSSYHILSLNIVLFRILPAYILVSNLTILWKYLLLSHNHESLVISYINTISLIKLSADFRCRCMTLPFLNPKLSVWSAFRSVSKNHFMFSNSLSLSSHIVVFVVHDT